MKIEEILFSLLRAEVCGDAVSKEDIGSFSEELLEEVYALSKKHDLAHVVGNALSKLGALGDNEISQKFKKVAMQAVYRYVRLNSEYHKICRTLEEEQIPFIPLKGSVLRNNYPEPWMRTSCDIDILVEVECLESAVKALVKKQGYRDGGKGPHDVSLFSFNGVHLELHYSTIEEGRVSESQKVLSQYWADARSVAERSFMWQVSDEMFYFYHIAHMAKHVEIGGCGIRPFLDLWILNHRVEYDRKKREKLLSEGGLLTFALVAEDLAEVWFSGEEANPKSQYFERFILEGGVYGNLQNQVAVQQTKKGSKLKYALYKIFLPYDTIKFHYPILQKHKWLTPAFEVVRWCKLLFMGGVKRSIHELKANAEISSEQITSTSDLLKNLGL